MSAMYSLQPPPLASNAKLKHIHARFVYIHGLGYVRNWSSLSRYVHPPGYLINGMGLPCMAATTRTSSNGKLRNDYSELIQEGI